VPPSAALLYCREQGQGGIKGRNVEMINVLGKKESRELLSEKRSGRLGCCVDGEPPASMKNGKPLWKY
jgi:hypothetical protein